MQAIDTSPPPYSSSTTTPPSTSGAASPVTDQDPGAIQPALSSANSPPPPYALLEITQADHDDLPHHLLHHALRDLCASQDPSQWGTRQTRPTHPHQSSCQGKEGEHLGWLASWFRWFGSLVEPRLDEGTPAWTAVGYGPVGGPFGLM